MQTIDDTVEQLLICRYDEGFADDLRQALRDARKMGQNDSMLISTKAAIEEERGRCVKELIARACKTEAGSRVDIALREAAAAIRG